MIEWVVNTPFNTFIDFLKIDKIDHYADILFTDVSNIIIYHL